MSGGAVDDLDEDNREIILVLIGCLLLHKQNEATDISNRRSAMGSSTGNSQCDLPKNR